MLEFDIKNKYDVNAIGVFYLPSDKSNQKILLGHVDRSTAKSIRGIFDMVTGSREKFRMTGVLQSVPNATSRAMVKITGVIMNKER